MFQNKCREGYGLNLKDIIMRKSDAAAEIKGSEDYPEVVGKVWFYQTEWGVLVKTEVWGLPKSGCGCRDGVFGYHIHSGGECSGNKEDAFADAKGHYSSNNCAHPYHSGDMPPLFGNNGYAFSVFLSGRFRVCEVTGRTVIIHLHPDDFHSQPSGDSGAKIACGKIRRV